MRDDTKTRVEESVYERPDSARPDTWAIAGTSDGAREPASHSTPNTLLLNSSSSM